MVGQRGHLLVHERAILGAQRAEPLLSGGRQAHDDNAAVLGVTIVRIGQLMWLHLFLGLVLVGPLALKLASTGYRFTRYYTGQPAYRHKGPPPAVLRAMAPLFVLDTLVVFTSGVALLILGPSSRGALLPVHKVSFIAWLVLTSLHVLGHLGEISSGLLARREARVGVLAAAAASRGTGPASASGEQRRPGIGEWGAAPRLPGSGGRVFALVLALLCGIALAVVLIPDFAPWLAHGAQHPGES